MVASAASRPIPMPLSPSGVPRPFQAWGTDNPHPFTGRPMYYFAVDDGGTERELRLQDHRARWLDLLHGRWLQRDPAGYVDGMNLYEYAANRPTVLLDTSGLEWEQVQGSPHLYRPVGPGSATLSDLVTKVMADSGEVGALDPDKDWACLWPVEPSAWSQLGQRELARLKRPIGSTYRENNWNRCWNNGACVMFDVSNLLPRRGAGATVRGCISWHWQEKDQQWITGHLEGAFQIPAKRSSSLAQELARVSGQGRTPISEFTVLGHSNSRVRELHTTREAEGYKAFSLMTLEGVKGIGVKRVAYQRYDTAIRKQGPPRCWFAVDATLRILGCNSDGPAQPWKNRVLRGSQTLGYTRALLMPDLEKRDGARKRDRVRWGRQTSSGRVVPINRDEWLSTYGNLEGSAHYTRITP